MTSKKLLKLSFFGRGQELEWGGEGLVAEFAFLGGSLHRLGE
jgi:hypothetical protein